VFEFSRGVGMGGYLRVTCRSAPLNWK